MKTFQQFRLDNTNQCLWQGETRVSIMPKPFAVLRYLVENAGRLVTQEELLEAIWPDAYVQPEVLRRYILEIRRILGDDAKTPNFIETLPKRGYRFIADVTAENAVGLPEAIGATRTLVGRESSLAELDGYLKNAMRGSRQIVLVVGEPGIGKTSLVDAFQSKASVMGGVFVARGQSVEGFGGKEPYYPILEALGQLARDRWRSLVCNTLSTNAPTWLIQFPSLIRAEQQATLQREIQGTTRERMVRELCEALEIITQEITLVLVLEDLHWVDHSTLDFISAVARRRESARLLVLGTFRPADLILSESPLKTLRQDLLLHHLSSEVSLDCLQESDVVHYLETEFAPGDLPQGLAAIIHRHSDGNPLFMTAMLDHLALRGVLSQIDGRWKLTAPLTAVDPGVPETLKQMLEVQLQHLDDAENELLRCASVAGQQFTAWSVAIMLQKDPSDVELQCDELAERQQFLKFSGTREMNDGSLTTVYEFRHSLYREVLYRRLPPAQRAKFHRSLAKGLEGLSEKVKPEMAAELALHCEEGRDYARAVQYLMVVAENATRRYAHRESLAALEHVRGLLPKIANNGAQELELQVLEKIGKSHYALGDMERSAAVYESMAARAAETGHLVAQTNTLTTWSHTAESIPFFLRAVELDPKLATAYTSLSRIYSNLGEADRARDYAKLAYELRNYVGERERLSITYQYHFEVTGDQSRATETLEEWKQAFPDEFQPVNGLTLIHNFLGNFARAILEGNEAIRRDPSHGYPYSNLAHAYRGIGRFDDARQTADKAVVLNIETLVTRRLLYQLAVLAGDRDAAARHLAWCRDNPREFDMVGARAQVAGYFGKVREARQLYEDTVLMAERRNLPDVGNGYLARLIWMELAYGNIPKALEVAQRVLNRNASYDPQLRSALAMALAGHGDGHVKEFASNLAINNPRHTTINCILVPIVRAGIELGSNQPERAIEELRIVAPYELGFVAVLAPLYLRAQSYLMMGSGIHAAEEFQRLLDHRGSDPFSPFYAVAPVGLARAHAMVEDVAGSLQAYEQFLTEWAGADPDVPILLEAQKEYDRLKQGPASQKKTRQPKTGSATKGSR
jgi:DNA-binding winged helix-turn-helix (wHTH) protein/tetratricopeptide (TPR) repeat protein